MVAVFAVVCSFALGGMRLAYSIKYDNKVITTVSDKKVYYAAVKKVVEIVEGENIKDILPEPEISVVVTLDDSFDSCDEVANAIIDNTDQIIAGSKLVVDGVAVACANTEDLVLALENRKAQFNAVSEADCKSAFCADVTVEDGYFVASDVQDISEVATIIEGLDVKTTASVTTTEEIAFSTVANKDDSKLLGYRVVERAGEKGIKEITAGVVYINGVKTEETVETSEIIKEPVSEVVTVGTKKPAGSTVKFSSGLRFPLPSGTWQLSGVYGESGHLNPSGHQGVDLSAPQGTPIMATASGRVTRASYSSDYGNCVIIEHNNGISTLYAHASMLCVNVGDYVSAGEVIALVGSTGYSTGNHLHFEIRVGNKRINPQPYIGL